MDVVVITMADGQNITWRSDGDWLHAVEVSPSGALLVYVTAVRTGPDTYARLDAPSLKAAYSIGTWLLFEVRYPEEVQQ